jgi:hypothetical protein
VDGLVLGELDVELAYIANGGDEFTWMTEPSECLEEKHATNPPCAPTIGVFCTGKNRVVKIAHSSSEVVLQTTNKHTIIYPGLGPCLEVIALRPAV